MHELPTEVRDTSRETGYANLRGFFASKTFHRSLVISLGSLCCLLIFLLSVTPKRYNLYVGMVPNQTISATKDVVDELTTGRNRDLAASAITPVYHYQDGITERVMANLENAYAEMTAVRHFAQSLPNYAATRTYSQEEYNQAQQLIDMVAFENFQLATLMNAATDQFEDMYVSLIPTIRNTMQGNVTQGQESLAINSIMQVVGFKTNINLLQNVVLPLLQSILEPNMVIDEQATSAARDAAYQAVEPVVFKQGQNIVVQGEGRIRENQMAMLTSLGLLDNHDVDYSMYIGSVLLVLSVQALLALCLYAFCRPVFMDIKRLLIIYLTAILVLALCLFVKSLQLVYLAPLVLTFMLLTVTIGALPAAITGIAVTLISSLMMSSANTNSMDIVNLLVMSVFAGLAAVLLLERKYQRSYILFTGAVVSAASFVIILAIGLMTSMSLPSTLNKALWALAGGAVSSLLCLALQPAVESMFNLPTPMRLLDLTNPNHPLMRRLLLEAPGTYHHSIIIANLAEAAAEAVGANPLLARAGAYFHDIGKLKRPLYFKENQIGTSNIHDTTDPAISAAIIISHVREGLAMARQHRLPAEVQQIIAEHHGNSLVAYFYHKAVQEAGDKPVNEEDYRYPGVPPQTAEGAIMMLCDTVEAAIRTLESPTREEIIQFIDKLIQQKVDSGMMINSPLTLKDMIKVRDACATVIYGVFHERIEYPKTPDKLPPGDRLLAHLQHFRSRPGAQQATPQVPQPEVQVATSPLAARSTADGAANGGAPVRKETFVPLTTPNASAKPDAEKLVSMPLVVPPVAPLLPNETQPSPDSKE